MDTHFIGFQKLGAEFSYDASTGFFNASAPDGLKGTYMLLDEASVTGTANVVMAAALAEGTTIYNAACEPYLQQLCKMINRMGGKISGVGSNLLTIEGVPSRGTEHRCLPDMIEIGSFIGLAAMTQSEITIRIVLSKSSASFPTCSSAGHQDGASRRRPAHSSSRPLRDRHVHRRQLADRGRRTVAGLHPRLVVHRSGDGDPSEGECLAHQKMFESRLFFVDKLIDMGAQIILCDPHRATVIGLDRKSSLRGVTMTSPDIRRG